MNQSYTIQYSTEDLKTIPSPDELDARQVKFVKTWVMNAVCGFLEAYEKKLVAREEVLFTPKNCLNDCRILLEMKGYKVCEVEFEDSLVVSMYPKCSGWSS